MGRQTAASRRMGLGAIVVLLCCVGAAYAQGGSVVSVVDEDGMMRDIVNLEPDQRRIESRQWAAVEWSLPLRSDPDLNPYDTLQIVVDVVLTAPSGAQLTVPAFWYEGFERSREGDAEVLTPTGVAEWRVRFTPTEAGEYSSEVHVGVHALGHAEAPGPTLEVAAALGRGFIRVNDANRRYFVFDDGTPYFALGHNVCWPNAVSITYDYDDYYATMAAAGESYSRLWLGPGWSPFSLQHDDALEDFDQRSAWRLDYVLDLAESNGLYVMLCFESFNYLRKSDPYPSWDQTPYRAEAGGPISEPAEFFTNDEATRWFQNRLRYVIARVGHSPHVLSWQFWNEVDLTEGYDGDVVGAWHQEMAEFVKQIDVYGHLVTTSFANTVGDPRVWSVEELDYVQSHNYGAPDITDVMSHSSAKAELYGRPHMFGEFGADSMAGYLDQDTEGYHLHEGIWASTMSGDAGSASLWWWDNYIRPRNLYHHFRALREFIDGAPMDGAEFGPIEIGAVSYDEEPPASDEPVTIQGTALWYDAEPLEIELGEEIPLPDAAHLPSFLHGTRNHPDMHNPLTLRFAAREPLTIGVRVAGVSGHGGAALRVLLNGEEALYQEFADNLPDDNETMTQYDGVYRVEVPAGEHRVTIENPGNDWFGFAILLEGASAPVPATPPARILGIGDGRFGYLWIRHRDAGWRSLVRDDGHPSPLPSGVVRLPNWTDGSYTVEWFDTWSGEVTNTLQATATGGELEAPMPPVTVDVAIRVRPEA